MKKVDDRDLEEVTGGGPGFENPSGDTGSVGGGGQVNPGAPGGPGSNPDTGEAAEHDTIENDDQNTGLQQ